MPTWHLRNCDTTGANALKIRSHQGCGGACQSVDPSQKLAWSIECVPGQPGLQRDLRLVAFAWQEGGGASGPSANLLCLGRPESHRQGVEGKGNTGTDEAEIAELEGSLSGYSILVVVEMWKLSPRKERSSPRQAR